MAISVLRGKFITLNIYIRKEQKSEFNDLSCHLRSLEKDEPYKSKASTRKKIIKRREEINETENIRK